MAQLGVMWPAKTTPNPTFLQIFARLVHYAAVTVAIYFIWQMMAYLVKANGSPRWAEFSKYAVLAGGLFFGGRFFRLVFGHE